MPADPVSKDAVAGARGRPALVILASVWALTLVALAGLVVWLELTYTPPTEDAASSPAKAPAADLAEDSPTALPVAEPIASEASGDDGGGATPPPDEAGAADASTPAAAPQAAEIRLAPAPAPDLVDAAAENRLLPVAGAAGRVPWKVYSRPYFGDPEDPMIALVIQGFGLDPARDEATLAQLPPEVTLALSPYAQAPQEIADRARAAGHEVLLMLPMEPLEYPANDPGPLTLLADMPRAERLDRLHRLLARFQGYVGVVNHMGSRLTTERAALAPVIDDLAQRGLLILDARTTADSLLPEMSQAAGLPVAVNDRYIDNEASTEAIDRQLGRLLDIAQEEGAAVGIGRPYPITLTRITAFARSLEASQVTLAPVSALAAASADAARAAAR